jgi:hypothetical protein
MYALPPKTTTHFTSSTSLKFIREESNPTAVFPDKVELEKKVGLQFS